MNRILNNTFFKSIVTLASGTILAQLITFLGSPIMTRIYTAEDIGVYTILMTAVSMFGGILASRYEMSMVYEDEEKNVYSLFKLSMISVICLSIVISFGYGFYYYNSSDTSVSFTLILATLFFILFLTGSNNVISSFLNRNKQYKIMSKARIYLSTSKEIFMIGLGLLNFGVIGLIVSQIFGRIIGLISELRPIKNKLGLIKKTDKRSIFNVAKKHKYQPIFSVPSVFANSFSYSSINLFVEMLYGATTLGFYSISYRVLGIPLTLISSNVSKVYFEEAAREKKINNNYKKTFIRTGLLLFAISIPMTILLILVSPTLFSIVFGREWRIAGHYVQILAPMYGMRLIVSPLTSGALISHKQHYELIVQTSLIIISVVIFLIAGMNGLTIEMYLLMISIFYSVFYIIFFLILFKLAIKDK